MSAEEKLNKIKEILAEYNQEAASSYTDLVYYLDCIEEVADE